MVEKIAEILAVEPWRLQVGRPAGQLAADDDHALADISRPVHDEVGG
jgi:hypothetical protein